MSFGPRVYTGVYIGAQYFPQTSLPDDRCAQIASNQVTLRSDTLCSRELGRQSDVIDFTPPSLTSPPPVPGGVTPELLVSASLRDGDYGGGSVINTMSCVAWCWLGSVGHGAQYGVQGVQNAPYGVTYLSTEPGGLSDALINWQLPSAKRTPFRTSGTASMCITLDRDDHVSDWFLGDNYGYDQFAHGQGTFGSYAGRLTKGTGDKADDQWAFHTNFWYNNTWYPGGQSPPLEYDRTYRIGIAWGGPTNAFEYWVDGNLVRAGPVPLPWGSAGLGWGSATNLALGDNHERGVDSYGTLAGARFSDLPLWKGYIAQGDSTAACPQHAILGTPSITTSRTGNATTVWVQTVNEPASGNVRAIVGSAAYAYGRYLDGTPDVGDALAQGSMPFRVNSPTPLYLNVSVGGVMGGDRLFESLAEIEATITEDGTPIARFEGNQGDGASHHITTHPTLGFEQVSYNESHPYTANPGHDYALNFRQHLRATATLAPSSAFANFSGSTLFEITDTPPSDQPEANAGLDQTVDAGDTVTLDGSDSADPAGGTLSYLWKQAGGEGVAILDAATATPSFEALVPGLLTFELLVDNSTATSLPDYVSVLVREQILRVGIDVKPGDPTGSINLCAKGVLPVAVHSSAELDVHDVQVGSLSLSGSGVALRGNNRLMAAYEDVNHDGILDLMVHFEVENLGLAEGASEVTLTGRLADGHDIVGTDAIRVVRADCTKDG